MKWSNARFAGRCSSCRCELCHGDTVLLNGRRVLCRACGQRTERAHKELLRVYEVQREAAK